VSATATANSAIGWSWSGPAVNPYVTSTQPVLTLTPPIQPTTAGVYYITAKFGLGSYTCASSSSAQLNVVPVNSVTVIPPPPVCIPDNALLVASAIGANNYSWVGPNGYTYPSANAQVYQPGVTNSGIYTVTAFFNGQNITCSNSNTVQLTINPTLTFVLTPRQQVCYNTPLSVIGPAGATGYSWTSSNGFTSNKKDLNFASVQPNNSGTYTLNINLGPCVSSGSTLIDVLTPITYSLKPLDRTICEGDTTVMDIEASGGSQNYAYTWSPSLYLNTPFGGSQVAVPLGSVIYNITTHDIACPNYTIGYSFAVTVNHAPTPTLNLRTRGCEPMAFTFNPDTSCFVTTYDFGIGNKFQLAVGDPPYSLSLPAGTYSLTVYSKGKKQNGGCTGTFVYPSSILVDPLPGTQVSWDPIQPTTADVITFYPTYKNQPSNWYWLFNGGESLVIDTSLVLDSIRKANAAAGYPDTSYLKNPERKYKFIGKYPVALISETELGCVDTVYKTLVITDDFKIFVPNSFTPNGDGLNDVFMVKASGTRIEGFVMELHDRWGILIYSTKDITQGWDGKINGVDAGIGTYSYVIKAAGINGEGRREFTGYFNLLK